MKIKQNKGFTLAEVLITLGIIGVVAALTIPTLMNNSKKSELRTGFQKANSLINNVVTQLVYDKSITNLRTEYCYENDTSCKSGDDVGLTSTQKLEKDILPYLKYAATNIYGSISPLEKRTQLNSITGALAFNNIFYWPTIYMQDGSIINIFPPSNAWPQIVIDTNGNKGPNKFGYDIFWWVLDETKAFPTSWDYGDGQNCQLTSGAYSGVKCAQYAIQDKCPWDSSKKYWDALP